MNEYFLAVNQSKSDSEQLYIFIRIVMRVETLHQHI